MKKGLFMYPDTMENQRKNGTGVYKKINAQVTALGKYFDVQLVEAYYKRGKLQKLLSRLPGFPNMFWYEVEDLPKDIDFIYFRHEFGDMQINRFFHKVKKTYPNCKIIVEFPCYPLDLKVLIKKWSMLPFKYKHLHSMKTLHRDVDKFVLIGNVDVKDIPEHKIITTTNGVDLNAIPPRKIENDDGVINIISVSHMMRWHRIDRLLKGLKRHYDNGGTAQIMLHLVGDGPECEPLKAMTEELNLQDHVIFYGVRVGDELNELFDKADISLDLIYENHMVLSSLKSREYWAKGLPTITSSSYCPDTTEISDYIMKVPLDSSDVDVEGLLVWHRSIYGDNSVEEQKAVADRIRQFAEKNCSIDAVMKPIVDYIQA